MSAILRAGRLAFVLCFAFASARASQLQWRQLGPASGGGRVNAVAGSDADPLLYYFGSAGGGVFKTSNGGLTWSDVWPQSAVGAIGAVAIAPSDKRVVWVGTGEATPRNDASYGDGVWLTRDGGVTWKHRGLERTYAIARIVIDPRNADVALAGALGNPFVDSGDRGVYRTADGGRTWRHTLYAGPQSGISDMALDTTHPNVVYAGVWQFRRRPWTFSSGGPENGIYKSVDGGVTWRKLTGNGLPAGITGRIGLAVAPSDSRRVYALVQSREGLLWRSDDAGAHWRMMSNDTLIDQRPFYQDRLDVDPQNRDHVFISSENLLQTFDGGKTFHDIPNAIHQDHHGSWISKDGLRIVNADDGDAAISLDGGKTWDWRFNVTIGQIYHVGYDNQNPYRVCGALQDNDSFCAPSLSLSPLGLQNSDWRDVANNADGTWAWPEPGRPNVVWNVGINLLKGQLGLYDYDTRQNYDVTPDVSDSGSAPLSGLPRRFNWEAPIAFSPKDPSVAYFGANVLYETRDRGRTWTEISPDLTRNDRSKQQVAGGPINSDNSGAEFYDTLLSIAPSPVDAAVIWIGTDDGVIARTVDGGIHWENVTPKDVPEWGRVEAVEPSHVSPARAYAVVNRHLMGDRRPYVLRTDDGGATWTPIAVGLPSDQMARVVREDPANPDVLYAGLEQGAWISLDRGAHWESFRLNMPSVSIHDLLVQPASRDLIAGTHGRGIYVFDDLTPLEHLSAARASATPTLFPIRPAYAWYYWWTTQFGVGDTTCCPPAGEFSAPDPPYGAAISYYLPRAVARPALDVLDASGRLVRTFEGSGDAGINRVAWDLAEAPPVAWNATGNWNKGPSSGTPVVPGQYAIRLRASGQTLEQPLTVLPDPRASWTQAQYRERYDFLRALNDELSAIDSALNRLAVLRKTAAPSLRAGIDSVHGSLTSGVLNPEDGLWRLDRVRERLTTLQVTVAYSQGPPLPPHYREAAIVKSQFDAAMTAYDELLRRYGLENAR